MEQPIIDTAVSLGKYGTVGVMLAMIGLIAFAIFLLWKMATNHIQHSNSIFTDVKVALQKLTDVIDRNTEIVKSKKN